MKRLGVLGGMGPESTIAYYRLVVATVRERWPVRPQAPVLINSIDVQRVLRLAGESALRELTDYLVSELEVLAKGGAALGVLAANTPHIVFDDVRQRSPIPLVSIVEAACEAARARGLKRLGIFGTKFTMQGRFYPHVFSKAGISLLTPRDDEQDLIHERYVGELLANVFSPDTRERLLQIARAMQERDGVHGIILAGTELPLLLTTETASGMPLLDTTRIHVQAAVEQLWG
jgi:aspartate racemase